QTRDLALRPPLVLDVGERRPAPQRKRLPQRPPGLARNLIARELDEALELRGVGLRPSQHVAGTARLDRPLRKRAAQLRDVALDDLRGGGRWVLVPKQVDQAVAGDLLVRM